MSDIEDQPTPEQVAEEKRRYMREYMRARRQSKEHGDRYRATARESMRTYMREYSQRPDVKAATSAKAKAKREAERAELAALRVENPKQFVAKVIAKRRKPKQRKKQSAYMRKYRQRPEVIARRRELFEQKPEEYKEKVRAAGRARAEISRIAKANGVDTKTVREILGRSAPAGDKAA